MTANDARSIWLIDMAGSRGIYFLRSNFDLPIDLLESLDPRGLALAISLISMLLAGAFLVSLLRKRFPNEFDSASLLALTPMAGVLMLIGLSLPVFILGDWWGKPVNYKAIFMALTIGLGIGVFFLQRNRPKPITGAAGTGLLLTCLFCGLILLRLVFIRDLGLPPYSDSIEHYQVINDLLHPENPPQAFYNLARLSTRYYHFGFHALAGWVAALSGASIGQTMLVLGQVLQAMIPVSLFFLVRRITGSNAAGLWTVLLAGLGWRMPGFASNWGKYPALTCLAVFPFSLGMLSAAVSTADRNARLTLSVIALAGGFLSTLSHTRGLLLLAMAIGGWWVAGRIFKAPPGWRIIATGAFVSLTAWVVYRIFTDNGLIFMLAPYTGEGLSVTMLVALLVPFGLRKSPRPMISALLFLLFLLTGALMPLPPALGRFGYQSLLDRPFTQMVLFLPLTIIGGIGFAGLAAGFPASSLNEKVRAILCKATLLAALLLPVAVTINAFRLYEFSPSDCCQLAGNDDLAAYVWIKENMPKQAVILIASNRTPTRAFGVDGGIWITPLTGYRTEKWPHNSPMDSPIILEQICAKGATHIYAGGTSARFSVEQMESKPGWYENQFTRPGAYVYKIIGCPNPVD